MNADILFLEKGCAHCGSITACLDMESVARDDFRTPDGSEFLVFISMSNRASVEILGAFGQTGRGMPLLVQSNGEVLEADNQIIAYIKSIGASR
jgi:hypothetical protein